MAHKVKCPFCNETFDSDKEPYEKKSNRYYHKECFAKAEIKAQELAEEKARKAEERKIKAEETPKKKNLMKCYYCNEVFDISKEEYAKPVSNRYAHLKCYEENYKEDDDNVAKIYNYLGKELMINYDFVQCERQRKGFIKNNGYTNEGILLALKYFYEVKKQSADRSGNRIGIVPYVYDEAQTYFKELNKKKIKINKGLEKQIKKEAVVIKIIGDEKKRDKGYIDLSKLEE